MACSRCQINTQINSASGTVKNKSSQAFWPQVQNQQGLSGFSTIHKRSTTTVTIPSENHNTSVIFGTKPQLLYESQSCEFTVVLESYSFPLTIEDFIILHLIESLGIMWPTDFTGCWCSNSILSTVQNEINFAKKTP